MNRESEFHTVRGYDLLDQSQKPLTHSMEDYLEMIFRFHHLGQPLRVGDLAQALHVTPPSTTRMVKRLAERGFLSHHRYGGIQLTARGREYGAYLLERHNGIAQFLRLLGVQENLQEDTERLEHNLSRETVDRLLRFARYLAGHPEVLAAYRETLKQEDPPFLPE